MDFARTIRLLFDQSSPRKENVSISNSAIINHSCVTAIACEVYIGIIYIDVGL